MRRRLGFWRRFAVVTVKSVLTVLTRREWSGSEHIPATGGVIIAPNHLSESDPVVLGHFVYDAGRWPHFLGKASLFRVPLLGRWLHAMRQIPVHRGTADAIQALDAAVAAVRDGAAVIIYPEGTTTRSPDLWPMRGKTGVARIWLATGVPVIPVVMWGPHRIHDARTAKLRLRPRTPVTVAAGPPMDLARWAGLQPTTAVLAEITDAVMLRLRDMLAAVRGETPPPLYEPLPDRVAGQEPPVDAEEKA